MGAMGEGSGKVQKASTYISSLVGVDVTSTQVDSTTTYVDAFTLPNAEHRMCPGRVLHWGNGGKFKEGSKSKYLLQSVDLVEERYMPQHTHK